MQKLIYVGGAKMHTFPTQEELTLRLCTRGGDSQEPRKREELWED